MYIWIRDNCGLVAGSQFNLLVTGSSSACVCVCTSLRDWQKRSWENHRRAVQVFSCQGRRWQPCLWVASQGAEKPSSKPTVWQPWNWRGPPFQGQGHLGAGQRGGNRQLWPLPSAEGLHPHGSVFLRAPTLSYPSPQPPPKNRNPKQRVGIHRHVCADRISCSQGREHKMCVSGSLELCLHCPQASLSLPWIRVHRLRTLWISFFVLCLGY